MPIDSALGRLGIKQGLCTSSTRPANPFEGQVIYESDTNRTLVYDNSAWLVIADNQVLSIDSTNSRVGIGTTTPSQKLHVNSGAGNVPALFESTDSVSIIQIKDNATTTPPAVGAVGDELRLQTSGSSRVTVDSSGNVGINDTTPSYTLDVNGDINTTGDLRVNGKTVTDAPRCYVSKWSNHTLSSAAYNTIPFDVEIYDTHDMHSTTSNTSRLTVPTGWAGYYLLIAGGVVSAGTLSVTFLRTGSRRGYYGLLSNVGGGSAILYANEGDYFEWSAYASTTSYLYGMSGIGGDSPHFIAQWLSA